MKSPQQLFDLLVADGDFILDRLDYWAERAPDKTFIHYGDDGVALSYSSFRKRIDGLAAGLAANGVEPGMPVSVLTRNALVTACSMFAIWRAGAIFAPVNFNLTGELLAHQLRDTKPAALVTDVSFLDHLAELWSELGIGRLLLHEPQPGDHDHVPRQASPRGIPERSIIPFHALQLDTPPPAIARSPFSPASIIYTSGTTGPAKGVLQSFRWINQYSFTNRALNNSDDVVHCDLPLYHVGGAFHLLGRAAWNGSTIGLWDRFSTSEFWNRIAVTGATSCSLVGVMLPRLLAAEPSACDPWNTLNKLHIQPYNRFHHAFATRFGVDFVTVGYGQTEGGSVFSGVIDEFPKGNGTPPELYRGLSKDEYRDRAKDLGRIVVDGRGDIPEGFMGRPSPLLEVALLNEFDTPVRPGAVGQLCLRPRFPGLLLDGYHNAAEATVKVMRNCWFHTGDACRLIDKEQSLYAYVDRMGGFFRVHGENVSSHEVEMMFLSHEAVRAAAAISVPATQGEEDEIAVFVELHEGHHANEAILQDHAIGTMPKYMRPRHIRIVEALPVTATNKIEKYRLKAELEAEMAADIAGKEVGK